MYAHIISLVNSYSFFTCSVFLVVRAPSLCTSLYLYKAITRYIVLVSSEYKILFKLQHSNLQKEFRMKAVKCVLKTTSS